MRHRKRRVIEGSWFNLNSITSPTTGRKHYEISVNNHRLLTRSGAHAGDLGDIRLHFDPAGNRGGRWSTKWKYSNRETAEQLITMAILKFGA
jgi:hypothetical protein